MNITHPMLQPWKPTDADPWDFVKAAHLLNRAGFGGTLAEIDRVLAMGPAKAVDWLMDFPDGHADEIDPADLPDLSPLDPYPKTDAERRAAYAGKTEVERMNLQNMINRANGEVVRNVGVWWLKRMFTGTQRLHERLTLQWHGHFTTSARDERSARLIWMQNETLRRNAAGNFATFVKQISRDPAMLDYLNNNQNRKGAPNENYARELMELFTLGIGNYTEYDIKEAARSLTGWGHDGFSFVFRPDQHDTDLKNFMGRRGPFDGDDVIDIILQNPECARYIAGKLFSWFAYDNTDPVLREALAVILRGEGYEMRPLIRVILTSRAFYSPQVIGSQIKSPVQLLVGLVRALETPMPPERQVQGWLTQMGQIPLMPPNVKGWPGGRQWINSATMFARYNFAVAYAANGRNGLKPAPQPSAIETVDYWTRRLIQRPIQADKREALIAILGENFKADLSIRRLISAIVSMPEFQLC